MSLHDQQALAKHLNSFKKKQTNQRKFENRLLIILFLITLLGLSFISKKQKESHDHLEKLIINNDTSTKKEFDKLRKELLLNVNGLKAVDRSILQRLNKIEQSKVEYPKSPYKKPVTQKVQPKIKHTKLNALQVAEELKKRGFTEFQASGIAGNIMAESSGQLHVVNHIGAIGTMQWLGGRKQKLVNFANKKGKHWSDKDTQLDYIAWELQGGNKHETKQFRRALKEAKGDVKKLGYLFGKYVERPSARELKHSAHTRMNVAHSTYKHLTKEA